MSSFCNSIEDGEYETLQGCTQLPQCGYVIDAILTDLDKLKTNFREFKEKQTQINEDHENRLSALEKADLK